MDTQLGTKAGETEAHHRLKRRCLLWAQAQGFSACAVEVSLPRCRYRADVAAYRPSADTGVTAIFECKQTRCDLRRDNCCSSDTRSRLDTICRRRQVLEKHLRIHYPNLRVSDSLFPEFDSRFSGNWPSQLQPGAAGAECFAKPALRLHQIRAVDALRLRQSVFSSPDNRRL